MSIAILEQGLGSVLLALSAPQPAIEQSAVLSAKPAGFDLARLRPAAEPLPAAKRGSHRFSAFPDELPLVRADDAAAPPAINWNPSGSSLLRIVPAKVRYRLHF